MVIHGSTRVTRGGTEFGFVVVVMLVAAVVVVRSVMLVVAGWVVGVEPPAVVLGGGTIVTSLPGVVVGVEPGVVVDGTVDSGAVDGTVVVGRLAFGSRLAMVIDGLEGSVEGRAIAGAEAATEVAVLGATVVGGSVMVSGATGSTPVVSSATRTAAVVGVLGSSGATSDSVRGPVGSVGAESPTSLLGPSTAANSSPGSAVTVGGEAGAAAAVLPGATTLSPEGTPSDRNCSSLTCTACMPSGTATRPAVSVDRVSAR